MGQYYIIVNKTKRQYVDAHSLGGMSKFVEFMSDQASSSLFYLMGLCNGTGGGDLKPELNPLMGSWAGDKVAVVGDYWGYPKDRKIFTNYYKKVHKLDIGYYRNLVSSLEKELATGYPYFMGDKKKYIKDEKKRLAKYKRHLAKLEKTDPKKLWINISDRLKADIEKEDNMGAGYFGQ